MDWIEAIEDKPLDWRNLHITNMLKVSKEMFDSYTFECDVYFNDFWCNKLATYDLDMIAMNNEFQNTLRIIFNVTHGIDTPYAYVREYLNESFNITDEYGDFYKLRLSIDYPSVKSNEVIYSMDLFDDAFEIKQHVEHIFKY